MFCNAEFVQSEAVELSIDGGSTITVQAGKPPIVNGTTEGMRVDVARYYWDVRGQWKGLVDEVVIVDDHITGVVSEHQAGKVIDWQETGIRLRTKIYAWRYFQVAEPGNGWGTNIEDPLDILEDFNPKFAKPGQTLHDIYHRRSIRFLQIK